LTGEDLHKVTHAYGTNGIITEVEMPLTAAYDWVDVIVGFDSFMGAARRPLDHLSAIALSLPQPAGVGREDGRDVSR
jgi:FAD/FMN-containing dehydrogenase